MAYDYNKYMKKYHKEKLTTITLVLNNEKDADILKIINPKNKSGSIKELIRKGMGEINNGV